MNTGTTGVNMAPMETTRTLKTLQASGRRVADLEKRLAEAKEARRGAVMAAYREGWTWTDISKAGHLSGWNIQQILTAHGVKTDRNRPRTTVVLARKADKRQKAELE